ncbi:hypothetical protein RBA39_22890, partial [Mycobacteroides abscessus subsp. massiliense]
MPPRKKAEPQAPSTMKELKDTLWKAADMFGDAVRGA